MIQSYHQIILYRNNKFKISSATWNDKFELADGSYSASDIQDYFENIIKKYKTFDDNPPIKINVNKKEYRTTILNQDCISS